MAVEGEWFRSALQRTAECLPPEALERVLEGGDTQAAAHVQGCAFCSAEVELLKSFRLAEVSAKDAAAVEAITRRLGRPVATAAPVAEPRRRWWHFDSWLQPSALAAACVLAVVAIGLELRHNAQPSLRGAVDPGSETFRSGTLAIVSPSGDLASTPDEIRWDRAPGATAYSVRLLEVDGNELWSIRTADTTSAVFPAPVRALMVPAKTLEIVVAAFDVEGRKIAESEPVRFRILQNVYRH